MYSTYTYKFNARMGFSFQKEFHDVLHDIA